MFAPIKVTVTPGSTNPCESRTTPRMEERELTCGRAKTVKSKAQTAIVGTFGFMSSPRSWLPTTSLKLNLHRLCRKVRTSCPTRYSSNRGLKGLKASKGCVADVVTPFLRMPNSMDGKVFPLLSSVPVQTEGGNYQKALHKKRIPFVGLLSWFCPLSPQGSGTTVQQLGSIVASRPQIRISGFALCFQRTRTASGISSLRFCLLVFRLPRSV